MSADLVAHDVPVVTFGLIPSRRDLAKQLNICERTLIRYEHAGLPVILVGKLRMYDPARVRGWLISQERSHDAPRRGRPAKKDRCLINETPARAAAAPGRIVW